MPWVQSIVYFTYAEMDGQGSRRNKPSVVGRRGVGMLLVQKGKVILMLSHRHGYGLLGSSKKTLKTNKKKKDMLD